MVHLDASERAVSIAFRLRSERGSAAETEVAAAADEREAAWAASSFAMRVLDRAQLEAPPWDRASATEALRAAAERGKKVARLDELEARRVVRVVLAEVQIPFGVRRGRGEDPLELAEREAITVLTDRKHAERQHAVWIGRHALSEIINSHLHAHPDTPTLEQLVEQQLLEARELDGEAGFRITRGWAGNIAAGAANLWHRWMRNLPTGLDIKAALLRWLRLTNRVTSIWEIPGLMTGPARTAWLNTAMQIILEEPDLLGWSDEGERLRWEVDYPGAVRWEWSPPFDDPNVDVTLVDRYFWLEEFEREHRGLVLRDDARSELDSLIAQAVRHDADENIAYVDRCAHIRTLLLAGATRPHLLRVVPSFICHSRPEALAWLAADDATASLALNFVDNLQLRSPGGDGPTERLSRSENLRTEIWKELFDVVLLTIRSFDNRALAKAVDECIAAAARRAVQVHYHRPDIGAVQNAAARARFDYALGALREATRAGRRSAVRGGRFGDDFVVLTAFHLMALWSARIRRPPRPDFASSFPLADLHLLLWLLAEIQAAGEPAQRMPPARSVAFEIAAAYTRELTRKGERETGIYWGDDQPRVAALAWPLVGPALNDNEFAHLVRPMDWETRLNEIVAGLSQSDVWSAVDWWMQRVRLHLRVLFTLHSATIAPARLALIEDALGELLVLRDPQPDGEGTLPIFRDPFWKADSSVSNDLPEQLIDVLWQFAPNRRAAIVDRWARATGSLADLLAIAAVIDLPHEQQIIQRRIVEFNVDDYLKQQHWFDRIAQMAQDAAVAKIGDLARQILAYGDRTSSDHAYGPTWRKHAFRTRLMLAYLDGDLAALDALVPAPPPNNELTNEMKGSHAFYRGLLELNLNPLEAVRTYTQLVEQNPQDLSSRLNLIAAHLEAARGLPMPERRTEALAQLDALQRLERDLQPETIARWRSHLNANRLDVFDLAEEDARFDRLWAMLLPRERYSIALLKRLRGNAQRRGNLKVFTAAWRAAQPQYMDAQGSMWPEFEALGQDSDSALTQSPTAVESEMPIRFAETARALPSEALDMLPNRPRRAHRFLPGRPWIDYDRESLPGRQETLARLVELVVARCPIVLLGQRRAGKTSVLRHLERRLLRDREVCYFSLEGNQIRDRDDFAFALSTAETTNKHGAARAILADPKTANRVYLIDELAYLRESDQTVFGWLRQLWHVSAGVVLAGTPWDWVQVIERSTEIVPGSSFGNDLTTEELGAISQTCAIEFLVSHSGDGAGLDPIAAQRIVDRCGTWPYYLNIMGDALLRAGGPIDEPAIARAYETALLRGAGAAFRSRWAELPPAVGKLLRAHPKARPDLRQLGPSLRVRLLDTGLCSPTGEWLDDRPFYDWIEHYAFEGEL